MAASSSFGWEFEVSCPACCRSTAIKTNSLAKDCPIHFCLVKLEN
uniref:Uncharacterized protein n=1 Tax=Rhizophora mucronata TaxID=61149 RepID=A0A2P2N7P5_RHIMU